MASARTCSELVPTPVDLFECILDREATVGDIFSDDNTKTAVRHIGEGLFEHGHISSAHVRGILEVHGLRCRAAPGRPM